MSSVVSSPTVSAPSGAFKLVEVARLLSVSKRTLEREIDRGRLQVIRIGRCVRVDASALAAYRSNLSAGPSSA